MQADIFAKRRRDSLLFFAVLALITLGSVIITEYDVAKGFTSVVKAATWGFSNFYPDAKSLTRLPDILIKLRDTVLMSIASTTVAAVFAGLLALLGSRITKVNRLLAFLSRSIASLSRNIPVAVWALVLLFSFGQSTLTGYFALFFVSLGFLTRSFIETIDEVSGNSVEALQATGAGYFHIVFQAVLPSSMPQMISWLLYMIETNIRSATLVGILTGAGIGFAFDLYYKTMNYHAASLVVLLIVITVFVIEFISNTIRRVIL